MRVWLWLLSLVSLGLIAACAALGWIAPSFAIDAGMGVLALAGLFALLGRPWDLYFRARHVVVDQDESAARGIAIRDGDREAARRLSRRLLALCLSLHLGAAALLALASIITGGQVGYAFAIFFLSASVFRPIDASYRHLSARLGELSARARHPRQDVLEWVSTVRALDSTRVEHERRLETLDAERRSAHQELLGTLRETDARLREQDRALDLKLDRVLSELDRTVDRMTEDRELVAGLRALSRLLKTS